MIDSASPVEKPVTLQKAKQPTRVLLVNRFQQFKFSLFKLLRTTNTLKLLAPTGILLCRDYIPANTANVGKLLQQSRTGQLKIQTLSERDRVPMQAALHLPEQNLSPLQPFVPGMETLVLEINDPNFSLRHRHLLDGSMNVIDEEGKQFERMPISKQLLPKARKLSGTVAYLSNVEPTNYYHWMCRTLPLIRIYRQCFNFDEIDSFYIGNFPLADIHRQSLVQAGIPLNKIVQEACTADRLLVAVTNRIRHFGSAPINQENYEFVRDLFREELEANSASPTRRLYVKRGKVGRRKVLNEEKIIGLLNQYDFEVVEMDGKTLRQQIDLFQQAAAIVAPHGAALTNLLFVQPGTKVLELFPYGFINSCYYVMANYAKAEYYYLQGEQIQSVNDKADSKTNAHALDLSLNLEQLEKICRMAFSAL